MEDKSDLLRNRKGRRHWQPHLEVWVEGNACLRGAPLLQWHSRRSEEFLPSRRKNTPPQLFKIGRKNTKRNV